LAVQKNAYSAFPESFIDEDWYAGSFLWNWYYDKDAGGANDSDYTPQGKPVMKVIRNFYD
jgi:hypothetical protein